MQRQIIYACPVFTYVQYSNIFTSDIIRVDIGPLTPFTNKRVLIIYQSPLCIPKSLFGLVHLVS